VSRASLFLQTLRVVTKSLRTVNNPAEIRTGYVANTSVELNHYIILLGKKDRKRKKMERTGSNGKKI
jgi:hypothetical protein